VIGQDELLNLIDGIYGAAADFGRWPATLERVADAFGAREASLAAVTAAGVPWLLAPRTDPAYLASYGAYYHPLNRFWQCLIRLPPGTAAYDQMLLPKDELQGSEFYNDWSAPQGYLAVLGATLFVEDGWRFEFMVPGQHDFTPEHLRLHAALAPHLTRALQLNQRLARAEIARAAPVEALDRLEQGVVLVDGEARVLFANRAAEAAFDGGLRLRDRVLRTDNNEETSALHALIDGCRRAGAKDHGGHVCVVRGPERAPLSLLVVPLRREAFPVPGPRPVAAIFIADPEAVAAPALSQLQDQYGLTRAEAALTLELLKGDGMQAAADRLGVLVATARTHLHRVLAKTGTRRQADLVRLILSSRHGVRRGDV
jgi:DNA-binding CsgD family transcriptional regulator